MNCSLNIEWLWTGAWAGDSTDPAIKSASMLSQREESDYGDAPWPLALQGGCLANHTSSQCRPTMDLLLEEGERGMQRAVAAGCGSHSLMRAVRWRRAVWWGRALATPSLLSFRSVHQTLHSACSETKEEAILAQ